MIVTNALILIVKRSLYSGNTIEQGNIDTHFDGRQKLFSLIVS